MTKCENCIYHPHCDEYPFDESGCDDFKDRSLFVELPCKVGDSLWCVYSPPYPANPADKGKWYMGEFEVARFHYGVKGLSIEMYGFGTVAAEKIGKTVFLSREEAEKALAERRNNEKS